MFQFDVFNLNSSHLYILRACRQVQGVGARGIGATQRRVVGNLHRRHQKAADCVHVFQGELQHKVLIHVVFFLILQEFFTVTFPHREMHKGIGIFVERHHQAGKVHLAGHFEVKEITIQIDASHHQIIVDD